MTDATVFSGAPGEDVDALRRYRAIVVQNVKNVSKDWKRLEKAEKTEANMEEREKVDDGVIDILDQIDKLSKKVVAATLERPHMSKKALENMDKLRQRMYVALGALTPLAEMDEPLLPAGDAAVALFKECVDSLAPGWCGRQRWMNKG